MSFSGLSLLLRGTFPQPQIPRSSSKGTRVVCRLCWSASKRACVGVRKLAVKKLREMCFVGFVSFVSFVCLFVPQPCK